MPLTDVPESTVTAVEQDATRLRELFGSALGHADVVLLKARNIVRDHGRSAIAAELGSDAAAMLTVYNSLRDAVEAGKAVTVEELPE